MDQSTFPITEQRYAGAIDSITKGIVEGWAIDRASGTPAEIVLFVDGKEARRTVADRFRRDLALAGIGAGHHGFKIAIPSALLDGRIHTVAAGIVGSGVMFHPKAAGQVPAVKFANAVSVEFAHSVPRGQLEHILTHIAESCSFHLLDGIEHHFFDLELDDALIVLILKLLIDAGDIDRLRSAIETLEGERPAFTIPVGMLRQLAANSEARSTAAPLYPQIGYINAATSVILRQRAIIDELLNS